MKPYYEHRGIAIYHGDARALSLAGGVLVTDPPYGMAYKSGWSGRSISNDVDTAARDAVLAMWGDGPALVFGRWSCPRPAGVRALLTWNKGDWPGMGDLSIPWGPSTEEIYVLGEGFVGPRSGSVLYCDRLTGDTRHPNEKPVPLMRQLLEKCPPGRVVDPFMGSGSTLVAAKEMGREAIGIELEEEYCEVAAKRLAQEVMFADVGASSASPPKAAP